MRIGNLVLAFVLTAGLSGVESYQKEDALSRDRNAESESRGKPVVIDIEAESRLIVPCLRQAFEAAGWNWSTEFLTAYTGLAFVFSIKEDGGGIWQRENYEWSYFFDMLGLLGDNFEIFNANLKGDYAVSPEVHFKTRAEAWDAVRTAIDAGLPPVVWQLQSEEMRKAKRVEMIYAREWALPRRGSRPYMWSLIVGYNEATQRYLVDSDAAYGKYAVRWDAFGVSDPAKWFCVMIIKPQT
ncbi:MAG: hypothetical protein O7G87_13595, partial [bacterium]|nr:hypothetical protein [bacterium]